jgi:23S rRNA (cytidine1920-2'-O)/16S rRNA (cytidine1409-2'-O)-methyltransferase
MGAAQTPPPSPSPEHKFVSRGGFKLRHALDVFGLSVAGLTCADLGASTGGFTDCLLQAGAARVFAVDTAYGEFAWKLRQDPRVVLLERTNALHARRPEERVDLVMADLGWTPQRLLIPAALKWLRAGGRIVTLIKPHYELKDRDARAIPRGGVLPLEVAEAELARVIGGLPAVGVCVQGVTKSPVLGGSKGVGNAEWLALLTPATDHGAGT